MTEPNQEPTREKQLEDQLLRLAADFENFRRRTAEENLLLEKDARRSLLLQLLPLVDNFDRALQHDQSADLKALHGTLQKFLEKNEVKKIESLGKPFDHALHEAISTAPGTQDEVMQVFEEGYTFDDEVLRHARVQIGDGSAK